MTAIGTLTISSIKCDAIIGINPEERINPQPVELTVKVEVDFEPAQVVDGIVPKDTSKTVDWNQLARDTKSLLLESKFYLAETACVEIGKHVLRHSIAHAVTVRLTKFEIEQDVESVSAEIRLDRLQQILD